jgi:hypothetical protein
VYTSEARASGKGPGDHYPLAAASGDR